MSLNLDPVRYPVGGPLNVLDYGADPTGATTSTAAIKAAVVASMPHKGIYIPAGTYLLSTALDLSDIPPTQSNEGYARVQEWSWFCEAGVTFQAGAFAGPAIKLSTTGNFAGGWFACRLTLPGQILGSATAGQVGLTMRGVSDCFITIGEIKNFTSHGIVIDCTSDGVNGNSFFNNEVHIARLSGNQHGLQTLGSGLTNSATFGIVDLGFQGNEVHINQSISNRGIGVTVDDNGNLNGNSNRFYIGAAELNGTFGVQDNSGSNYWEIGNTNGNANGSTPAAKTGFVSVLATVKQSTSVVKGVLADGAKVHGGAAGVPTEVVNWAVKPGIATAPAVPASTVAYESLFDRPAAVYVSGGTVTNITVDGTATGLTAGTFRILPGGKIAVTYSVVPTWVWDLTA